MQQLSFKNRIASHYIITTALLIFVVFFVIYSIVKLSVYNHLNTDIAKEVKNHLNEIGIKNNTFYLMHAREWEEREHNTVDVNPVFIQFLDKNGDVIEKSPNLKNEVLYFNKDIPNNELFDTKILGNKIRQIQVPIFEGSKIIGYLIIAMSLEGALIVLQNLEEILIIAYPLILIVLFFIARFIAGRSIKPISSIIKTSNIITKDNLTSRIPLPQNKDELFVLSQTINNLLDRIETAIEREKQFTSDASHELRTPLTVIKGTLEVLIRKPRNPAEYEEKINFCVKEVNRLNHLVDQLLLLARFENQTQTLKLENVYLNALFLDTIARYSSSIQAKKINVLTEFSQDFYLKTDNYLFSIIINNLISNAVKYSNSNDDLTVKIINNGVKVECYIIDSGIGIPAEDLERIFNPFYRSKSSDHPEIKGTGLGLSIVKKLCSLLGITISITSQEDVGTKVILSLFEA
ncbi:MAG: HAMP domain-containing histidine kinase [Flavobacterium sp.]|jgi:signal transduction histidine kinase|uniref:HAMP domain-containing sensor histidine kinase n=1 Tax=Flavobacterium sp. TaxID=239 RepID=UPI001B5C3F23|nr:HAMP domain-containing sensor histidine kinase [Flavobacterium sp.]MBP6146791.1 HAMP domain-containing histidine kinase [Flavobacterium sp.]MBP7183063.1 HAMP domain-containing histidine kinase [Flavobacterium sp.]MBP8887678.1 HAMP domain-containing histidine kinase [Flavobacterium sp.]HRL72430.1 HAMP domain-containing sensor histidine kinase [Flavobacterium sp.]HRM46526.1 HAMP domain-containing sensor histidine kinase [Flavobacterium sp.]